MATSSTPRLRTDVTWRRFPVDGVDTFTFRDEVTLEYLKLDAVSSTIALAMDGTRTIDDLVDYSNTTFPSIAFDRDYLVDLVEDLHKNKLLEDPFARNAMLAARLRKERSELSMASLKNLIQIDIGAVNPDAFLTRTYSKVAFMFERRFIALGFALFFTSCYVLWTNRDRVVHSANGLFTHGLAGVALIWVAISLVLCLHELGHGYAVKRYGGKVPRMGFLLIFGLPGMFCDTSDMNLYPDRKARVVVAIAGAYTELYSASVATLLWYLSPPDGLVSFLCYNVMMFSSVSGLIFNFNPLIKLDGYFVLSDWLEISDLQENSYRYLGYLFRRHVLRMKVECPVAGHRRKRIFAVYGLLSLGYAIMFGTFVYLLIRGLLIQNLAWWGVLLSLLLLPSYLRRPVGAVTRTARLWALDHRGLIRRGQAVIVAAAVAFLVVFFLVPIPGRRGLIVRLEPAREEAVIAPEELTLERSSFVAGQAVRHGDVLAVLDADSMRTGADLASARAGELRVLGEQMRRDGDDAGAVAVRAAANSETESSELVSRRVERAVLRAPFDGRVLSPSISGVEGVRVEAGDTVCVVGDFSRVRASAEVSEFDLEDVLPGATVRLRLRVEPDRVLRGRIAAVEPIAVPVDAPRRYRAWIDVEGIPADPRAGLSAVAYVRTAPRTPASHIGRMLARFVRADLWV